MEAEANQAIVIHPRANPARVMAAYLAAAHGSDRVDWESVERLAAELDQLVEATSS